MIRKFNYTNRIRIKREDISIALEEQTNGEFWFVADVSEITEYGLPPESLVFLEAYRLANWMRFSFGRVGALAQPENRHLERFETPDGIKFRIKVTADGELHKIIAEANAIPLLLPGEEEGAKDPLLPVMPSNELGEEIYRLDFSEDKATLLINSEVGYYKDIGRSPAFISLVLPNIFREILTRIVIIEKSLNDDDMEDWRCRWIRFAKQLKGVGEPPSLEEKEECSDWIQNVVSAFAKGQKIRAEFALYWRGEE